MDYISYSMKIVFNSGVFNMFTRRTRYKYSEYNYNWYETYLYQEVPELRLLHTLYCTVLCRILLARHNSDFKQHES